MGSGKQTRRVLVFAGSTREGSVNKRLAKAAAEALSRSGLGVTYVDLRDYPMPLYDGDLEVGTGVPETARVLKQLLRDQAALVIASPEYNGSYSGVLKNVIDWVSRPEPGERPAAAFRGKTAALMAASPGGGGGKRGLQHVRELLHNIGVSTIPAEVVVSNAFEAFDDAGNLVRAEDREQLDKQAGALAEVLSRESDAAA